MKIIILLFSLVCILGCDNTVEPIYMYSVVVGVVKDKETGLGLDSVRVFIYTQKCTGISGSNVSFEYPIQKEVITNQDGIYKIDIQMEEFEIYYICVQRSGYWSRPKLLWFASADKIRLANERFQRIDIELTKKVP